VFGAKLAGKVGSMGIAYLGAVDNSDQSATGAPPVYNMLRLRRDLGPPPRWDRLHRPDRRRRLQPRAGIDAHVVWRKIWFSEVQIAGAWTRTWAAPARASCDRHLRRPNRSRVRQSFELLGVEKTFRTRAGS